MGGGYLSIAMAIFAPARVAKAHAATVMTTYSRAPVVFPALTSRMKSAEKVEKVVNPPQKPTHSNNTAVDEFSVWARNPMSIDPATLTVNVPTGIPPSVRPESHAYEIKYRAAEPKAPPAPTAINSLIIAGRIGFAQNV